MFTAVLRRGPAAGGLYEIHRCSLPDGVCRSLWHRGRLLCLESVCSEGRFDRLSEIAAGTGATAFALFSVACLLAAILQVLWEIKEALEMVRLDVRESRREALQYRYKTHP